MSPGLGTLTADVRLPKRDEAPHLIMAPPLPGLHKEPMTLLTRGVLTRRHDARRTVETHRSRWAVQDGLRAFKQNSGVEDVGVVTLRAIQRLVLPAAVAMAFVMHLAQQAKASCRGLVNLAARDFDQPILYGFCRFAFGLRNLVTAEQRQAHLKLWAYG